MDKEKYYMNLPKDLSGSIAKNRFRLELLWGISKIIDEHKANNEYTIIFDFKCDIELHKDDELNFYQIKTKKVVIIIRITYVRKARMRIILF